MTEQGKEELGSVASSSCQSDERSLPDAIHTTAVAINLCLSNKFYKAQRMLEPWAKESMYHALGYGTIMYLQAVMTFEPQAIQQACESVKDAMDVCDKHRHKQSWSESLSSWIWNPSYEGITEEERHAELCYAECLLQRALLTFIQDENFISFIKGALKIKACYNSYKTCFGMVMNEPESLQKSPQRKDFEGGVHLGIGGFNLLLSLLPTRILRILEYIGFSGDKYSGLEHLDKGCKGDSLRSPMCAMVLLGYHSVITYYLGIGDGDVEYADEILQPFLKAFPKGAIFLYFAGRIKQVQGRLDEAEERYSYSIQVQSEWKQFHHICYWELMWCYSLQENWPKAFHYACVLLKESRWSKTTYMYLKGSFRFMARITGQQIAKEDDNGKEDSEEYVFRHLPNYKQRIAGKSIPFEKYSIHKSVKYFSQGNWLFLPGLELIYMWNGFQVLRRRPDLSRHLLNLVKTEQQKLEETPDREYYIDDWCLGKILEGMCFLCMGETEKGRRCLVDAVERPCDGTLGVDSFMCKYLNKRTFLKGMTCDLKWTICIRRSQDLVLDKQLGAYACAEVGFLSMEQGNYVQAKKYLKSASHDYQGYFLESRLHFRIHSALHKIKIIEKEHKVAMKKAKKNSNKTASDSIKEDSECSEAGSNYSTASEGEKTDAVYERRTEEDFTDAPTDDAKASCSTNTDVIGPSQCVADNNGKAVGSQASPTGLSKPKVSQTSSSQDNNNQRIPNLLLETSL